MKTLQELKPLIIEWAKDKGLVKIENAPKQRLKLIEECGELASAILENNIKKQKDAIGDIFVVLVILAEQLGEEIFFEYEVGDEIDKIDDFIFELLKTVFIKHDSALSYFPSYLMDIAIFLNYDLIECANIAWNEIKDRKGKTVDGTFIKN